MEKGFIANIREFFGIMEGKKLGDLAAEIKALSPQDRWDLVSGFQSGHGEHTLTSAALEKEREKATAAGIVKAGAGYGGLAV